MGILRDINDTHLDDEASGISRGATLVVAASNASDKSKSQADYLVTDYASADVAIQAAIDALPVIGGWQVGHLLLTEGGYTILKKLTTTATNAAIMITGRGWPHGTALIWDTGVAGDYILDFYASAGQHRYITLKDMGLRGGTTGTRVGKGIKLGRATGSETAQHSMSNIGLSFMASDALDFDNIANIDMYNVRSTENDGWDMDIDADCWVLVYGGTFQKVRINESLARFWGVGHSHVDIEINTSHAVQLDGTYFDPVPSTYASHVIVGSAGQCRNTTVRSCEFKETQTNLQSGGFYIDLQDSHGAHISGNGWRPDTDADPPTSYINIAAGSNNNIIDEAEFFPFGRIANAGSRNKIRGHEEVTHYSGGGGTVALSETDIGTTWTNLSASGTYTFTLPQDAIKGAMFKFVVMAAQELRVDPGAAGGIYINGAKQTDNMYISANDEAESVTLVADGNGDWFAESYIGTWTVEV